MIGGPATPFKTVHGIAVSTQGIIVPSTPKGQTGEFPIQVQKIRRRTELIPPPPPTTPQQLEHSQADQTMKHIRHYAFLLEQESQQACWELIIVFLPTTREQQTK